MAMVAGSLRYWGCSRRIYSLRGRFASQLGGSLQHLDSLLASEFLSFALCLSKMTANLQVHNPCPICKYTVISKFIQWYSIPWLLMSWRRKVIKGELVVNLRFTILHAWFTITLPLQDIIIIHAEACSPLVRYYLNACLLHAFSLSLLYFFSVSFSPFRNWHYFNAQFSIAN